MSFQIAFFYINLAGKQQDMDEFIISLHGSIDEYWYNRNYFKYFLDKAGDKPIRIKLSSRGGNVFEAVAISNLFTEYKNVTVEFIGFNASAATWMAFGASSIEMHEDSMWLAHKCSLRVDIYGSLNADEIESKIKELQNAKKSGEAIDLMIAQKYADKCKRSIKDVMDLMAESRWMSASEALEWGFVDKVIPGINKKVEITDEITNEFNAAGLPIPEMPVSNVQPPLVRQIIDGMKSILPSFITENPSINNNEKPIMKTEFVSINQILNCQGFEEKDGRISLTLENMKMLDDALKKALDEKVTAENNLANALDEKKISDDKYAAAVNAVDTLSEEVKNAADFGAKIQVIKDVFEKVPGVKPVTPTRQSDGKADFSDVAIDPINNFDEE